MSEHQASQTQSRKFFGKQWLVLAACVLVTTTHMHSTRIIQIISHINLMALKIHLRLLFVSHCDAFATAAWKVKWKGRNFKFNIWWSLKPLFRISSTTQNHVSTQIQTIRIFRDFTHNLRQLAQADKRNALSGSGTKKTASVAKKTNQIKYCHAFGNSRGKKTKMPSKFNVWAERQICVNTHPSQSQTLGRIYKEHF